MSTVVTGDRPATPISPVRWWTFDRPRVAEVGALAVIVAAFVAVLASTRRAIAQPFWYDEQWRGYFVSVDHNWWSEIRHSNAPMSAGWYGAERLAAAVFGNRESVLRAANIAWLIVLAFGAYAIARRWMNVVAATVLALVTMVNGALLTYALQFKPFVADAAGTVVALAALLYAREARSTRRRVVAFVLASLGLLVGTPAVFVIGPVIAWLLVEGWRGNRDRVMLFGLLATAVVGALHLRLFIMRQSSLTKIDYWNANFVPHSGASAAARFVWNQTGTFVPEFVTGSYRSGAARLYPIHLDGARTDAVAAIVVVLLVLAVWHALLDSAGRILLFGTAVSFPLTLVASWMRLWPYGFVRTNYYVVPLLYILCGMGGARLAALGRTAIRVGRSGGGGPRRALAAGSLPVIVAALMAGIGVAAVSASVSLGTGRYAVPGATLTGYGRYVNDAVIEVRKHATSSTAVVVVGAMALRGWQYYMFHRDGLPGTEVPPARTDLVAKHGTTQPARFLAAQHDLTTVYYYAPMGSSGASIGADERTLNAAGFCRSSKRNFFESGVLIRLDRC